MPENKFKTLEVEIKNHVLTITLNRPEVRNAFNDVMIQELTSVFNDHTKLGETRAILLKGNGPVFCAGGDLNWMKRSVDFSYEENLKDTRNLANLFALINECPKPVVGAVHGAAIGGGVGLVSVCDIVLATVETQFSLSEVRLGIVPACIGPFVISKVGMSHARRLFMSAERFRAQQAKDISLVHEIFDTPSKLSEAVQRQLDNIVQCGPNAVKTAKELVLQLGWHEKRTQLDEPLEYVAKLLAEVRISEEGQEGVRAFLEKRSPSWLDK